MSLISVKNNSFYRISSLVLFCMFFIVDASFRLRDFDDKSIDFQVIIKSIVLLMTILMGMVALKYTRFYLRFYYISVFFLLILVSAVWSENPFFTISIFFTYVAYFLFLVFFIDSYGLSRFLKIVTLSLLSFLVVSFFLYVFFPEVGRFSFWFNDVFAPSWRMTGLTTSANNFGRVCGFFILFLIGGRFLIKEQVGNYIYYLCILMASLGLVLSGSRTTMAILLISVSLFVFLESGKKDKAVWVSLLLLAFSMLAVFMGDFLQLISRDGGDDITSLTGRTFIWDAVLYYIEKKPFLGYGFGSSIFLLPEYADTLGFTAAHAHNMYLQVLLSGGYLSLIPFIFMLFICLYKSILLKASFVTSSLVFVCMIGLFEAGAISLTANTLTLLLFLLVYLISTPNKCIELRSNG